MLPTLRMLAGEMPTLAAHAEAYVELAARELAQAARRWSVRAALLAAAAGLMLLAVGLAGVGLMLWAALPAEPAGPARWMLWALPSGIACIAAITAALASRLPASPAFVELRLQWRQDMALLRGDEDRSGPQSEAAP